MLHQIELTHIGSLRRVQQPCSRGNRERGRVASLLVKGLTGIRAAF